MEPSALALTLSNPMTIFSFIAIFTRFCGSAFWWLTLSIGVNFLRNRLNRKVISCINKAAGLAIIGFAIYLVYQIII